MSEDGKIRMVPGKEKLIVMPFCPGPKQEADGRGLGLHFLAGNLICLHRELLECWFGWRVKKIFPGKEALLSYCSGSGPGEDMRALGEKEKVRFWLDGTYTGTQDGGRLSLSLWDTGEDQCFKTELDYAFSDRFAGFCAGFFDWLDRTGLGFSGRDIGAWPEAISARGLDALGRALKTLYLSYVAEDTPEIDLTPFREAVTQSPGSYLTQDLLGWGLYKNGLTDDAVKAFDAALATNPDGMGAHAGKMWIALAGEDRERALHHALEKGRCRGEDPEKARAFVAKKLG